MDLLIDICRPSQLEADPAYFLKETIHTVLLMPCGLYFSPRPVWPQGKMSRNRGISNGCRGGISRFSFDPSFFHANLFHQVDQDDIWSFLITETHMIAFQFSPLIPSWTWWGTMDIALTHKKSAAPHAHSSPPFLLQQYFYFQDLLNPLSSFPSVTQPNTISSSPH